MANPLLSLCSDLQKRSYYFRRFNSLNILFTMSAFYLSISRLLAQPAIEWDKALGGNSFDNLNSAFPIADGGYILGGF